MIDSSPWWPVGWFADGYSPEGWWGDEVEVLGPRSVAITEAESSTATAAESESPP